MWPAPYFECSRGDILQHIMTNISEQGYELKENLFLIFIHTLQ